MTKYFFTISIILISILNVYAQDNSSALDYISKHQSEIGFSDDNMNNCFIKDDYTSKHNGVRHIYVQQSISDIPVENTVSNINISRTGEVLNINKKFISTKNQNIVSSPVISSSQALDVVLEHLEIPASQKPELRSEANDAKQTTTYVQMENALDEVKMELHYIGQGKEGLRLAWKVVIEVHNPDFHIWVLYVDTESQKILEQKDRVIKCTFNHKHTGSCTSTPYFIPEETCEEEKPLQSFLAPDSYLAYPLRVESPNHGARETLVNPADLVASPYGWHDTNGAEGAEYNFTRGNNVLAQDDLNGNNGSGFRPNGGNSLDFIFTQDLDQDPSINTGVENLSSSITNLFVWNNLMHDIWYKYGFDEESGNFQSNNYGNGGQGGDYVLADGQDGSGQNNANFASGIDGDNGRMQMYMWDSPFNALLDISSPSSIAGVLSAQAAGFGQEDFNVSGELILMDDGSADPTLGCVQTSGLLNGKIALIDRGDCEFGNKALLAQNGGAIAVIICNNEPNGTIAMGAGADGANVNIPAVMISQEECATIRMELPATLTVSSVSSEADRDGSLDNGIIAHEYGHGISTRITGGPSSSCLFNDEQGGEGWSDFFSLVMTQTLDQDRNTARGIGTYAQFEETNGPGIRTYPYTTNMEVNPHTYADISTYETENADGELEVSVHGVGSVLCAMLWDLYWNLTDEYGFDDDIYNGTGGNNIAMQLVIDGLKFQPCSPGFIDVRDAIIQADEVNYNGENRCIIWNTFARRGLGYGATQGSSFSVTDGVESFLTPPDVSKAGITKSSDLAIAEIGDIVTYTLNISNACEEFNNLIITDILPEDMTYVDGSASDGGIMDSGVITWPTIGNLPKGSDIYYTYQATVNSDVTSETNVIFSDDMENGTDNWTVSNTLGQSNWVQDQFLGNTYWFADELIADPDPEENQYLVMNPIVLSGLTELSFSHKYDTEQNWDGGRVEISLDNGLEWLDLGDYFFENGYNDYIRDNPDFPAFSGNSSTYITSKVDLSEFCGLEVLIRFNFYYDQLEDGRGWNVDDVVLTTYSALLNIAEANADESISQVAHCLKLEGGVSVSNENLSDVNTQVNVYPNPSSGNEIYLSIQSEATIGDLGINVFNAAGQVVFSDNKNVNNDFTTFKLIDQKLAAGIYTVQLVGDEFSTIKKFIVF